MVYFCTAAYTLVGPVERHHVALPVVRRQRLLGVRVAARHQPLGVHGRAVDGTIAHQAFADDGVDLLAQRMARGHQPGVHARFAVNARSKRAAVLLPAPSRMFDDGGVQERVRLVRPATRETMARPELDASNWRRADEPQWRALWEHEIAELPSHRESRFWLAAGLLLPIWDRLPLENMRVRRLITDDGEALIGRVLDASQVRAARASFGLDGGPAMTGEEAFEAVMARGTALPLANGWRLARRRIMGADRVEIEGPADTDVAVLKRIGCTVEIVSYRARAFAPAAQVLDRVLERWPLAA